MERQPFWRQVRPVDQERPAPGSFREDCLQAGHGLVGVNEQAIRLRDLLAGEVPANEIHSALQPERNACVASGAAKVRVDLDAHDMSEKRGSAGDHPVTAAQVDQQLEPA